MSERPLAPRLHELLRSIVIGYIQFSQDLETKYEVIGHTVEFTVRVHQDDYGKMIGTSGKNIKALQSLFSTIGQNKGIRIEVYLIESVKGAKMDQPPFSANPKWNPAPTIKILSSLLEYIFESNSTFNAKDARKSETTYIEITNDGYESINTEFKDAIHTIFHAIGKSNGRKLHTIFVNPYIPSERLE